MNWERFNVLIKKWLPGTQIVHPYPEQRLYAKYPRWMTGTLVAHVRICAEWPVMAIPTATNTAMLWRHNVNSSEE
jgi:hypothetical protein